MNPEKTIEQVEILENQAKTLRMNGYCIAYHILTMSILLACSGLSGSSDCGIKTQELLTMAVLVKMGAVIHYLFKTKCIRDHGVSNSTVNTISWAYLLGSSTWHWTVVERFINSKNQCFHANQLLWTGHTLLTIEPIILAFWAGAYIFGLFIKLVEESNNNGPNMNILNNQHEYLAKELSKLRHFISSHFKDTCRICSGILQPDQMVIVSQCAHSHVVHYSCDATSTNSNQNCPSCEDSNTDEEVEKPKIIPFAEILAQKYEKVEEDRRALKERKKRKYSYTDF
ncbi:unnamed protein product [Moneuplotes crassus]|uniref:RING-type domain-containing protein n=1 Tax=Euplotes crassus TaxID=5936 RepID=A0AAD2D174_EUPCR|nr:unnamed protein product [Moneuplotes crassus]